MKKVAGCVGFLFGLFPEDGDDMFSETSPDFQLTTWPYIPELVNVRNIEFMKISYAVRNRFDCG
jgi:hypothetical protein